MTARDSYRFQRRLQEDLARRLELPEQVSRAELTLWGFCVAVALAMFAWVGAQ